MSFDRNDPVLDVLLLLIPNCKTNRGFKRRYKLELSKALQSETGGQWRETMQMLIPDQQIGVNEAKQSEFNCSCVLQAAAE